MIVFGRRSDRLTAPKVVGFLIRSRPWFRSHWHPLASGKFFFLCCYGGVHNVFSPEASKPFLFWNFCIHFSSCYFFFWRTLVHKLNLLPRNLFKYNWFSN
uniref:(northern house mosquito) hypothetical protein n=1 Tax=Culex pipiens TaxID=7175 RepID=A0A8D8KDE6_CULPI